MRHAWASYLEKGFVIARIDCDEVFEEFSVQLVWWIDSVGCIGSKRWFWVYLEERNKVKENL